MYGKSVLFSNRVVSVCNVRNYKSGSTKKLLEFLAEMPKPNSARIIDAQRQRQQISKKGEKYAPSTVYLQVLGSGAHGAPNTLYLFTDQKRYLFNCGECTQRLAHEHKVKLSRLDHIFITSKTWKNIGGLPGLSLTLQDVGVPNITLHGPEGLDELYKATRRFVIMKDMNVTMATCSPSEDFDDNVMSVKYVLLGPHDDLLVGKDMKPAAKRPKLESNQDKEFEEFIHDETDYYKPEVRNMENGKHNRNPRERMKPKASLDKVSDPMKKKTEKVLHDLQKKTNCSVAYICTLKKRLGTLDLAKCVEMGVKPGPMLGQLKSGHDVVLPDGTLVLSKDVKTPDDPGPVFIILDVPELSYLKEAEFSAHFDNGSNPPENIPTLVVHYTPPDVFNHPTYRAFMLLFGPSTRHLVLNAQNSCLGSEAVHRTQHKLHLLDPDIFPLLRDASVPAVWNSHPPLPKTNSPVRLKGLEELKNKIALAQFQNIINLEGSCKGDGQSHSPTMDEEQNKLELIAGRTLTMFHLRPKKQLDRSAEPKLHVQDYIQETMDVDGFVGSLEHFRRQVDSMRYAKTDNKEFPKVVFLGTGSCIPSKTRNVSALVLHVDENRSMLLDCGEGTYGQLVRFYGPKKVGAFLRTLKAIYISHLHADHHIGLIGVIQARRQAMLEVNSESPDPLFLLAPGQIYTWLSMYDQQFERIKDDFTLIPNQNLLTDATAQNLDMTSAVLANIGVAQIRTCLVSHCPNAFGIAVDVDDHYKLTYSGDTIPCEELVKIGQNSTILIHEATMEDELADEARMKMHSTTSQAIDIGKQMNAHYTVLTHFSQRYARLPRLNAHILNDNRSVGIAFDNMQITTSDLELLPHMYAPLQLMFAEHCVEMELKAAHRARQKERASSPNLSTGTPSRYFSTQVDDSVTGASTTATDDGDDKSLRQQSRSKSRSRKVSPGCFATLSAPAPRAKYRESNASRLRQEIKGMTVTGVVRGPGSPRSKSSSPTKIFSQPATPKQNNSGTATPKTRGRSPAKSIDLITSRLQNPNNQSAKKRQAENRLTEDSPDKSLDLIATPRTMSETSNVGGETQERLRSVMAKASSGYVVDTRSKTLTTTAVRQPASAVTLNAARRSSSNILPAADFGNGYGKPLVTSLAKRLTVMKNLPKSMNDVKARKLPVSRAKSPLRSWRTEPMESASSVTGTKFDITTSKTKSLPNPRLEVVTSILFHLIFWRLAHIASYLCPPLCLVLFTIIAVGVLFWTAAKGTTGNKLRTTNYTVPIKPDDKVAIMRSSVPGKQIRGSSTSIYRNSNKSPIRSDNKQGALSQRLKPVKPIFQKDTKSRSPEFSQSPSRRKGPVSQATINKASQEMKTDKKDPPGLKPGLIPRSSPTVRVPEKRTERPLSELRDMLTERLKQPLCSDKPISVIGRPASSLYSRSFKPQLEDIKSSFMLLNKKPQEQNKDKENRQELVSVLKPKPLKEEFRKQQLKEIKNKFKSKHFYDDSKFDKIEGLNWISWK